MSQNFIDFQAVPYRGLIPQAVAVGYCGDNQRANVIPITIDWDQYGTGAVEINLQAGANVRPGINAIRSCVIDNTFCSVSCIVQFPDTNFTVVSEADVVTSGFVLTNQLTIRIFNIATGVFPPAQQTRIFLCDFHLDTYTQANIQTVLSLWVGTSSVDGSRILAPPALGQQTQTAQLNLGLAGWANGANLFFTPRLSGLIVVTSVTVEVIGAIGDQNDVNFENVVSLAINPGIGIMSWGWQVQPSLQNIGRMCLADKSGLNVPLSALSEYRFINANALTNGGWAYLQISYDWVSGTYFY